MSVRARRQDVDWSAVQLEYEEGKLLNKVICERHDITRSQLRYRREQYGWVIYRARKIDRPALIGRMLKVFDKQLRKLEKSDVNNADKEIGLLGTATKTLEKLLEIQDAEQPKPAERRDMADLRDKLAERIDQLKKR